MDRVLQVIGGMNRAGAETFLMNIYRCIDRNEIQFDFLVYSEKKQDYEDEILRLGGKLIRIPSFEKHSVHKYISTIKNVIDTNGPYIAVHAHTLHNSAFAMIATLKYKNIVRICHSHSTQNNVKTNLLTQIYECITKICIRKYSQIWLACGNEAGIYLFGENFNKKGIVVNNGINLEMFSLKNTEDIEILKKEFSLENELLIGSVARLQDVKNHYFMNQIARELKNRNVSFKMLFVGSGDNENKIKDQIKKYELMDHVKMLGVRQDIPNLLNMFDVFLMPSVFEGNPVTLIEAQASGLPCVITDTISEQIDMRLGLIKRCSLNSDISMWVNNILIHNRKNINKVVNIENSFKKAGYNSFEISDKLINLYKGNNNDQI